MGIGHGRLRQVNRVMVRAFLLRGALAIAALLVLAGMATSASSPPPWIPFITFFGVFLTAMVVTTTLADRRLQVRAGRENAPWLGSNASWCQFTTPTAPDAAPGIAAQAIASVGGRKVQIIHDSVAVGWIGNSWTNIPQFQEYQLSIVTSPDGSGGSTFTSCARPRWSTSLFGASRSHDLAVSLDSAVRKMTPGTWPAP